MKVKYKYHVAYVCKTGFSSQIITTNVKIRSGEGIKLIENFIMADKRLDDVVILNFILLDKKWGFWDWLGAIAELILLVFLVLYSVASFFG